MDDEEKEPKPDVVTDMRLPNGETVVFRAIAAQELFTTDELQYGGVIDDQTDE